MGKIVRKLRLIDGWRIGENESWLTDMATEGLHLKKLGSVFASFEQGEADNISYRICFSFKYQDFSEQCRIFSEMGWEFVCEFREMKIFRSPQALNLPEPFTDPDKQIYSIQSLTKQLILLEFLGVIISTCIIGMLYFSLFQNKTPLLSLIEGNSQSIFLSLLYSFMIFNLLNTLLSAKKFAISLKNGNTINHNADWKRIRNISQFYLLIIGILTAFSIASSIGGIGHIKTLPLANDNLSHVRLADIENNTQLKRSEPHITNYFGKEVDWGNQVQSKWSPFAPMTITIREEGVISEKVDDNGREYSPSMEAKLYELRFSWLVEGVLNDLIKDSDRRFIGYGGTEPIIEKENYLNFDKLFVRSIGWSEEVFASKGKLVIYIRYHGEKDYESIVNAVSELFESS